MSTRRILAITIFSILFIAALAGTMLLTSYLRRDHAPIPLPDASASMEIPGVAEPDTLDRVEVTTDNIQAVISTLSRPEVYSREILIDTYWEGGQAGYAISVSTAGGMTSLRTVSSTGTEKRIIVAADTLYIWYRGDRAPFIGRTDPSDGETRNADEYQMIVTYEDVLELDKDYILDAGYTEYGGEECIYAQYRQPKLGYTMKYYVSIDLGLITGAEEYDADGALVYRMRAGECLFDADASAFLLPDGTDLAALQ